MSRRENADKLANEMGDYISKMRSAMTQVTSLREAMERRITVEKIAFNDPRVQVLREGVEFYSGLVHTYKEAYDALDSLLKGVHGK